MQSSRQSSRLIAVSSQKPNHKSPLWTTWICMNPKPTKIKSSKPKLSLWKIMTPSCPKKTSLICWFQVSNSTTLTIKKLCSPNIWEHFSQMGRWSVAPWLKALFQNCTGLISWLKTNAQEESAPRYWTSPQSASWAPCSPPRITTWPQSSIATSTCNFRARYKC